MNIKYSKFLKSISLVIVFVLAFSTVAFAKGSDLVAPFPLTDVRAANQIAKAMAVDSGGNTIVAGSHDNGSNNDYSVVKFKADGTGLAWGPVYFNGGGDDVPTAVVVDSSNNIVVTGVSWNGSNYDIHTIKYDGATGAELWVATYNSGGADTATSIVVDSLSDVYVAGSAFNGTARDDFLIIKYPATGVTPPTLTTPTWVELYDDGAHANTDNRIMSIAAGSNGIAVTGYSLKVTGGSDFDILTRKYGFDKSPVREWRYASTGTGDDRGIAVKMDTTGNVVVIGTVTNSAGNSDIYTVKYDPATPTPLWGKIYDNGGNDEAKALWIDGSNDFYVSGITNTLAGNQDFVTARYASSDGTLVWQSVFDAGNGATDIPVGIIVDSAADGGVFVSGYSNVAGSEDYMTVKYRKDNGTLLWEKSWNSSGAYNDRPLGIALEPASAPNPRNVIVAGWVTSAAGYDFAVIKYDFGALNAPTGLTATALSDTSIKLDWVDNSSNEDSFVIQRKLGEGGAFADINTTAASAVTYTDSGLTTNNYYYYRIRAYNSANGDSYYSNEARALTKVISYISPIWSYIYDGGVSRADHAAAITVGADDNPIVAGYSDLQEDGVAGSYSHDYMTIKIDHGATPTIKWKALYDSGGGGTDDAAGVVLDNDGNTLVTGTAYLFGGVDMGDDLYTIKFNTASYNDPVNSPLQIWADQYGTQSGVDQATAIEVAHDSSNNSVVIGYGNGSGTNDIFIIKYNAAGTRAWTPVVYNRTGRDDYPTGLALDSAGDIFVSGYSLVVASPTTSYDWFVAKYSGATGALIWSDEYDASSVFGVGSRNDQAFSIDVDRDGNAFVTGYATNSSDNTVFYTVKYDGKTTPTGNRRIWEKSFNYAGFDSDAVAVKIDPIDGAVVVAGSSAPASATDTDFHLIRYNAVDGSIVWEKNFDKPDTDDHAYAMTLDSSGYIYLAGDIQTGADTATTDIMSVIYDYAGTFLGATKFDGAAHNHDEAVAIAVNYQGEAFIAGNSINAAGNEDYVVVKQKNEYILVPAPLTATAEIDYTKVDLVWHQNTPGTSFRIERTAGPSTPLSVWTAVTTLASGTTTYTDTGLAANSNYCYRIDASIASLNSRKVETCVTTRIPAPTLSPLTVDSATQITLNWSQVADNTGYKIERKITAGGTWTDLTTKGAGVITHVDTGLTAGTIYYYRVSANSPVGGYSLTSGEQSAITKPAAPAMSANGTITTTTAVINWTNVVGETGYKIERKEGAGGVWSEITTRSTDVITYTDTALTFNTQYYYRVRAYNASGDSAYSSEQGALTRFTTPVLATAVFDSGTPTQINLTWNDVGAASYTVQRSTCYYNNMVDDVTNCTSGNLASWVWVNYWNNNVGTAVTNSYSTTTGHTNGGYAYAYRIVANSAGGNSSDPSNVLVAWTSLTASAVTVAPSSETALIANWTNINGATNYQVEQKLGTGGTWAPVGAAQTKDIVTFTSTGLSAGLYCYRVKAYSTLTTPNMEIYSADPGTTNCLNTPLAAPVMASPTGITATAASISWNNVSGNTGYKVERCQFTMLDSPQTAPTTYLNSDANWNNCTTTTLAADTITYTDSALTSGYTYRFRVLDTFTGGVSAYSNAKAVTTIPPAPTLYAPTSAAPTQIYITWNNVYGETSYNLEWKAKSDADCTAGAWNTPISIGQNSTNYYHNSLTAGTYYCYRIYAVGANGTSPVSNVRYQTTLPLPPTLNAPSGVTATQAVLTWNNIANNTGYKIERKIGAGGTWGTIFTTAADTVTYTNTGLTAGTLYYYRISTNNAAGSSAVSGEQSTTTTPVATTVTAATISAERIDLAWQVKLGSTNYKIERKEGAGSYSQIDNVAVSYSENYCGYSYPTVSCPSLSAITTLYQNSSLTENTTYCYQIKSWNSTGGDSAYSSEVCATTSAMPNQNLTATALDGGFSIKLDWTPIACVPNACGTPTGYEIQREVRSGNWVYKILDAATLTYTDYIAIDPGKKYHYRVRSLSGADKSPFSEVIVFAKPYSVANVVANPGGGTSWISWIPEAGITPVLSPSPSPPSAPVVTGNNPSNTQVIISWTAGTGSTASLIRYGTASGVYTTTINPAVSPKTITGLINNTTYYFQVGAINGAGTTWSAEYSTTPATAPSAPTGIFAAAANQQVTISWTAGAGAATSLIKYGTTVSYGTTIDPATVPKTIFALTNGTTYHYSVGAKNVMGTTWSGDYTVAPTASAPSAVTGISSAAGNEQVVINWTAGTGSTSSLLRYGTAAGVYSTTIDPALTTYTITGLGNGTTYYYQIGAKNASGTTWSSEINFTPTASAPSAATDISVILGNAQATIAWTAGLTSTSSLLRYRSGTGVYTVINDPAATPQTNIGLTNGTNYYYQVGAKNSFGTTWSDDIVVTPTASAPSEPTSIWSTAGNAQVSIVWTAGASSTSSNVRFGTSTGVYPINLESVTSPITIPDLTNEHTIHYQVGATNANGTTWNTTEVMVTPTASAPSAPVPSSAPGNAQGSILWPDVSGALSYHIHFGTVSGVYGATINSVVSPKTITALTNGTAIYYQVGASNASGLTWSAETTMLPTASAPSEATGISSTAGDAAATISWSPGVNSELSHIRYGTTSGVYTTNISSVTSPHDVTGLTNDTTYYYQIGSQNAAGITWSDENLVTPTLPQPSAPTGINGAPGGSGEVIITWTAGANSTSSVIRYGTSSGNYPTPINPATSPQSITGLTPGITYYYQVGARRGGSPVWSVEYSVVAP